MQQEEHERSKHSVCSSGRRVVKSTECSRVIIAHPQLSAQKKGDVGRAVSRASGKRWRQGGLRYISAWYNQWQSFRYCSQGVVSFPCVHTEAMVGVTSPSHTPVIQESVTVLLGSYEVKSGFLE